MANIDFYNILLIYMNDIHLRKTYNKLDKFMRSVLALHSFHLLAQKPKLGKKLYLFILVFQQYFSYIMATSFSSGRSRRTQRDPPTIGKQLVNFITGGCGSSAPFFVIYKAGCKPTPYW
jgi:hypothetical protein